MDHRRSLAGPLSTAASQSIVGRCGGEVTDRARCSLRVRRGRMWNSDAAFRTGASGRKRPSPIACMQSGVRRAMHALRKPPPHPCSLRQKLLFLTLMKVASELHMLGAGFLSARLRHRASSLPTWLLGPSKTGVFSGAYRDVFTAVRTTMSEDSMRRIKSSPIIL
jgi:hypothetical protein